jgi:hypothetical protein
MFQFISHLHTEGHWRLPSPTASFIVYLKEFSNSGSSSGLGVLHVLASAFSNSGWHANPTGASDNICQLLWQWNTKCFKLAALTILYAFLISPFWVSCSVQLILFDLIYKTLGLQLLGEVYKPQSSSLCNIPHYHFIHFSWIKNLYCQFCFHILAIQVLRGSDPFCQSYNTNDKNIVLCNIICSVLECSWDSQQFLNWFI